MMVFETVLRMLKVEWLVNAVQAVRDVERERCRERERERDVEREREM